MSCGVLRLRASSSDDAENVPPQLVRRFDEKTAPQRVKSRKDGVAGAYAVTPATEKTPGAESSLEQPVAPNVAATMALRVRPSGSDWVCDYDRKAKKK
jgi:hypothetical protein